MKLISLVEKSYLKKGQIFECEPEMAKALIHKGFAKDYELSLKEEKEIIVNKEDKIKLDTKSKKKK